MSIKADSLKSNESQKKAIQKELNAILGHIDDQLKVAHDQGKHAVSESLPITFSIPYMRNKDAQRIIYYKVLTSLLERGFNAEFEAKKDVTVFYITWLSKEELDEIEVQNCVLAKHTKKDFSKLKLDDS